MRLSVRVFLGFFLIVGLAAYFLLNTFLQEVKPGVRQGMEVALVDTANLLAELASEDLRAGRIAGGAFAQAVRAYEAREFRARVWGREKREAAFRVYVTDARGILLFDSAGGAPGQDYSRWNDVHRTLRGEYGARATRADPKDETTSVLHVAAPIRDGGRLVGVLAVAAPASAVLPYARRSEGRVWRAGLGLMGAALALGAGISWWLTRAIGQLQSYARDVSEGRRAVLPPLGGGELSELGRALEAMRDRLEDRAYVERYVHTLTHEMKSPLAAIRGAGELLEEALPEADRARFVANILEQEARLRQLLERMLELAAVEQRRGLQDPVRIPAGTWIAKVAATKEVALARKRVRLKVDLPAEASVWGEAFLLEQALSNLLDNALAHAPEGGVVDVTLGAEGTDWCLRVRDRGPGLPAFAVPRLFEPFYSLPAPDTGKKGTGLGLAFVRGVAELHGGRAEVSNHPEGGAEARLVLPKA